MREVHQDIADCKYDNLKELLIGSEYFNNGESQISCECIRRSSVYSTEWDSEHREYYNRWSEGIKIGAYLLQNIFNLEDTSVANIEKRVRRIPKKHRKKVVNILKTLFAAGWPPFINRISLFSGEDYRGYADINPTGGISDVFLKPPFWMTPPNYFVTCKKEYNPENLLRPDPKENIDCVPYIHTPYSEIEGQIGVCAQYSVRLALMALSQKAPTVPELTFWASRSILTGGSERSQAIGWNAEEITKSIEREGYTAFRYRRNLCPECNKPLNSIIHTVCTNCGAEYPFVISLEPTIENIYAYVESGIPVILGVEKARYLPWWNGGDERHALVAIGHTLSEDGTVDGLIVHDVSTYPYKVLQEPLKNNKTLEEVIIEAIAPTYREITISYPIAKKLALELADLLFDLEEGETYRPQLVESNQIKRWLAEGIRREHFDEYSIDTKAKEAFAKAYMDRYVWLFEIKQEMGDGSRMYKGDILISATMPRVIGFNIPDLGICECIDENGEEIIIEY